MDFSTSSFFRNITIRKHIPLHYQKRFHSNISNSIFNQTFNSVVYKKKIKFLTQQNLVLAKALANREEKIAIREDIIAKNEKYVDRILESRQELQVHKTVLETAVAAVDRVLSRLNMRGHVSPDGFTKNMKYERMKFKKYVKRTLTPIHEIEEALEGRAETNGISDKESVSVPPASTKSNSETRLSAVKTREQYGLSNKQSLVRKPSIQKLKADASRCSQAMGSTKDIKIPKSNTIPNLNIVGDDRPRISSGNWKIADDNGSSDLSSVKRSRTKHTSRKKKSTKDTGDVIQFPEKPGECSRVPKEDLTVERITDIYQFPFEGNSPAVANSSQLNKVHQRMSKNSRYFSADNNRTPGKRNSEFLTSKQPLPVVPRNVRGRSHSPEVGHIRKLCPAADPDGLATAGSLNSVGESRPDVDASQRTSRRRKAVSYKEPSLNIKMRRS